MPRRIDPSKRYVADIPCPHDGTRERYVTSNNCCACRERWRLAESGPTRRPPPQHRGPKIVEPKAERLIHDPIRNAAFADSIRHMLRAGR